ncbi:uncharacterized protein BDR25DRAFT_301172 [Lindgomyces ingoldianus]|uniref:Uncharacterized protein n=1 Tax=Lindgomyces ingoldianus TaxID=673940 RepID=A0ACB6R8N7_9PLEO|nr:uncharacterized protein BDR25DRAFT_301172 [Lindgomyces ingoldianus]KAF2475546.1 hypothetical protein BDR25DRAFT_301172 [Lindgomyces ingoldianus]
MPESSRSRRRTAFISGPVDASPDYFSTHYIPLLFPAIAAGDAFIMGPVPGIDTLALHFLLSQSVDPARITVFMAHFEYADERWRKRYEELGVGIRDVEDAQTTGERDAAMTANSDYDILRYRNEEEAKEWYGEMWWPRVSNTEMNERRRMGVVSKAYNLRGSVAQAPVVQREGEGDERKEQKRKERKSIGKWMLGMLAKK